MVDIIFDVLLASLRHLSGC